MSQMIVDSSTVVRAAASAGLIALLLAACAEGTRERVMTPAPTPVGPTPVPVVPVPQMGGVYDLAATITTSDPAWGVQNGTRQIAVLRIQHAGESRTFEGTCADFRVVFPDGSTLDAGGGPVSVQGSVEANGAIVIELFNDGQRSSYWYGKGEMEGGRIAGEFGAGGHMAGTFVAQRR